MKNISLLLAQNAYIQIYIQNDRSGITLNGHSSSKNGGGRWIRTIERRASRFTVCPLWPLGNPTKVGAGNGGRTRITSLEGWCTAVMPYPHTVDTERKLSLQKRLLPRPGLITESNSKIGAVGGSWTLTPVKELGPEPSASAIPPRRHLFLFYQLTISSSPLCSVSLASLVHKISRISEKANGKNEKKSKKTVFSIWRLLLLALSYSMSC